MKTKKTPTNNVYSLTEYAGGGKPCVLYAITGHSMSNEYDSVDNRPRRRDVTLDEQRVYTQLDQINNKLEALIRLEEKHVHLEARHNTLASTVNEHGEHIENIIRDQGNVNIRMVQFETLRAEVEEVRAAQNRLMLKQDSQSDRLADTREKQSSIKGVMSVIGTGIILLIGLLTALGYWENSKVKNMKPAITAPRLEGG